MQPVADKTPLVASSVESVLVVERDTLFARDGAWQGLKSSDHEYYAHLIKTHAQFMPRSLVENNPSYKQVIPYLVFMYRDQVFVVQRRHDASEQRLARLMSVGIGGHVRCQDMMSDHVHEWAQREVAEELYCGAYTCSFLGFINDDSNAVGAVHFGVAYSAVVSDPSVAIKSELKQGAFRPLPAVGELGAFEPWSRLVLRFLLSQRR